MSAITQYYIEKLALYEEFGIPSCHSSICKTFVRKLKIICNFFLGDMHPLMPLMIWWIMEPGYQQPCTDSIIRDTDGLMWQGQMDNQISQQAIYIICDQVLQGKDVHIDNGFINHSIKMSNIFNKGSKPLLGPNPIRQWIAEIYCICYGFYEPYHRREQTVLCCRLFHICQVIAMKWMFLVIQKLPWFISISSFLWFDIMIKTDIYTIKMAHCGVKQKSVPMYVHHDITSILFIYIHC